MLIALVRHFVREHVSNPVVNVPVPILLSIHTCKVVLLFFLCGEKNLKFPHQREIGIIL